MQKCILCRSSEEDDFAYGEFLTMGTMSVHTYCLYLTSNLTQAGSDDQGFLGFLKPDIEKEVKRIARLKCCYCHEKYANIGCCETRCVRSFHFICGLENGAENQFLGTYESFCDRHCKLDKETPSSNDTCCICFDNVKPAKKSRHKTAIRTPCCRNGWFHKICLQKFAKTSGYFFKCPLCNDSETFRRGVAYRGIFIPNSDAAWELEPNAFSELLERPNSCAAEKCRNRRGRTNYTPANPFVFCVTCGGSAIHEQCIPSSTGCKRTYNCLECLELLQNSDCETDGAHKEHQNRLSDYSDDECSEIDVCGSETETIEKDTQMENTTNKPSNRYGDTNNNCTPLSSSQEETKQHSDARSEADADDDIICRPSSRLHSAKRIIRSDSDTTNTTTHSIASDNVPQDSGSESDDPLESFFTGNSPKKHYTLNTSCVALRTRRRSSLITQQSTTTSESAHESENDDDVMPLTSRYRKPRKLRISSDSVDSCSSVEDKNNFDTASQKSSEAELSFVGNRTRRRALRARVLSDSSEDHSNNRLQSTNTNSTTTTTFITPATTEYDTESSSSTQVKENDNNARNALDISCIANRTRKRKSISHEVRPVGLIQITECDYDSALRQILPQTPTDSDSLTSCSSNNSTTTTADDATERDFRKLHNIRNNLYNTSPIRRKRPYRISSSSSTSIDEFTNHATANNLKIFDKTTHTYNPFIQSSFRQRHQHEDQQIKRRKYNRM